MCPTGGMEADRARFRVREARLPQGSHLRARPGDRWGRPPPAVPGLRIRSRAMAHRRHRHVRVLSVLESCPRTAPGAHLPDPAPGSCGPSARDPGWKWVRFTPGGRDAQLGGVGPVVVQQVVGFERRGRHHAVGAGNQGLLGGDPERIGWVADLVLPSGGVPSPCPGCERNWPSGCGGVLFGFQRRPTREPVVAVDQVGPAGHPGFQAVHQAPG